LSRKSGGKLIEYEADPKLRDFENVPLKVDVQAYFEREVRPTCPMPGSTTKNQGGLRNQFQPPLLPFKPPRPLAEIDADLKKAEEEIVCGCCSEVTTPRPEANDRAGTARKPEPARRNRAHRGQARFRAGKSLLETVCAFANEPGAGRRLDAAGRRARRDGTVPSYEVEGMPQPDKLSADIATQCRDTFNHSVRVDDFHREHPGQMPWWWFVPEAQPQDKPIFFKAQGLPRVRCAASAAPTSAAPTTTWPSSTKAASKKALTPAWCRCHAG
jgi:hypothetical protein